MTTPKRTVPILRDAERASIHVHVEEIEHEDCDYCAISGRKRRATHYVRITGWVSSRGASGTLTACWEHANEAAAALKAVLPPTRRPTRRTP